MHLSLPCQDLEVTVSPWPGISVLDGRCVVQSVYIRWVRAGKREKKRRREKRGGGEKRTRRRRTRVAEWTLNTE